MRGIFREVSQDGVGGNIVFRENLPMPELDENNIIIQVKVCGLSLVSGKTLTDLFSKNPQPQYPVGHEIAGVVSQIGSGVNSLKTGDEVVGVLPLDSPYPGCADYCVCSEYDVVKKPKDLDYSVAAAGIGDGLKAYTGLHYLARICSGDTILITDGAASFPSMAIQLAQQWGAKVLTTSSSIEERKWLEDNFPKLAQVIDLSEKRNPLLTSVIEETGGVGVDCIIDNGVNLFTNEEDSNLVSEVRDYPVPNKHDVINCLGLGGRWVTCQQDLQLDPPNSQILYYKCASVCFLFEHSWLMSNGQQGRYQHMLKDIVNKLDNGTLRPNVAKTVRLEQATEQIELLSQTRVGKVIIHI